MSGRNKVEERAGQDAASDWRRNVGIKEQLNYFREVKVQNVQIESGNQTTGCESVKS